MLLTTDKLKINTNEIIEKASQGEECIITKNGKPYVKIIPYKETKTKETKIKENKLFGIWSDRKDIKDVNKYVRHIR